MRLPSAAGVLPPAGGAASAAVRQADYIVAVVNSEPITNNEVRQRAERVAQQLTGQGAAVPPHEQLAREVLERLILEKSRSSWPRTAASRWMTLPWTRPSRTWRGRTT
jgi:peptidyl-prolyl cis-trans isomerase SurA